MDIQKVLRQEKKYLLDVYKRQLGPAAAEVFSDKLKAYKTGKGTIRLFYHEPLQLELIAEIAGWCEKEYGE